MRSLLCEILKIEYAISDHAAPSCALPPAPLGAALARTRPSPLSQSRARPAGPLRTLLSRYSGVLLLGLASWVGGSAPRPSRRAPPAARSPTARIFPSRPHSAQKTRRRGHAAIRQAPRRHLRFTPEDLSTLYTLQLQHEHIMAISKRHSHAPRPCHRSRTDMTHRTHPGALLITTFASTGAYSTGTHRHRSGDIGRAVTTSVTFMKCSAGIIMDKRGPALPAVAVLSTGVTCGVQPPPSGRAVSKSHSNSQTNIVWIRSIRDQATKLFADACFCCRLFQRAIGSASAATSGGSNVR